MLHHYIRFDRAEGEITVQAEDRKKNSENLIKELNFNQSNEESAWDINQDGTKKHKTENKKLIKTWEKSFRSTVVAMVSEQLKLFLFHSLFWSRIFPPENANSEMWG